ncbi:GNAT family N-acetyltransferase [Photobacterium halotolerans]|nr:GNAT family N-acetyltransferase [Photobacterium halotolerans]
MGWPPNSDGVFTFNPETLDSYWKEASHSPYFIHVGKEIAGFALVRNYPGEPEVFDIEQFFVLRKFKGKGVGKKALLAVVANHHGKWQIRVLKENEAALKFWVSAVTHVVGSCYEVSLDIDVDLEMHFIRFETVS